MSNQEQDNLSNDIDKLHSILNRNIDFISKCDTKVSFWLSVMGVIFTILFTVRTPNLEYINENGINFMVLMFIISSFSMMIGIYFLIKVLIAKIECNNYSNSKIFFGHIARYSNYRDYLKELTRTNVDDYKEDLVSQIYTNSVICNEKFNSYNKGAKLCIYSLPILILSWSYIFMK